MWTIEKKFKNLKKYTIFGNNTEYLQETEIMAKNEDEALEKYEELWNKGMIGVVNSETHFNIF